MSSHGLQVRCVEVVPALLPQEGAAEGGLHCVAVGYPQLPPHVHTPRAKLQKGDTEGGERGELYRREGRPLGVMVVGTGVRCTHPHVRCILTPSNENHDVHVLVKA